MQEPKIPGGYILLSRKVIESEIWSKPPLYLKVWIYLLTRAQHSDYKKMKRGQLRTSIPEIIEECSWYVGYRKVKPTKDQIFQVIDWLRKPHGTPNESNDSTTMITTTKATQGLLVTIDRYCFYQESKNYESNAEPNNENDMKATREQRQPDNINKNDKNVKNDTSNKTTRSKLKFETHHLKLAELLLKKIRDNNPNFKEPNLESWANTFRLMMESPKEKRTGKEIQNLILFSQSHPFWHKNVLSADKLRKQFDRLQVELNGEKKPYKDNVVNINRGEENERSNGSDGEENGSVGISALIRR